MPETVAALICAYAFSNFVLLSHSNGNKQGPNHPILNGIIFAACLSLAVGNMEIAVLLPAAAHSILAFARPKYPPSSFAKFALYHALQITTVISASAISPHMYSSGAWKNFPLLPIAYTFCGGLIIAVLGGSNAVGSLLQSSGAKAPDEDSHNAGRLIGQVERFLLFFFVLFEYEGSIGFLIATKAIVQFTIRPTEPNVRSYIVLGTLASFAWALTFAISTKFALTLVFGDLIFSHSPSEYMP